MIRRKLNKLSRRYAAALRNHLRQGRTASLLPARGLGRQAVALNLETLDVARMHEAALASQEAASSSDGIIKRAELFFAEAITPIEETHRAALKANTRLNRLTKTLWQRAANLMAANQVLKTGIAQRKAAEQALRTSTRHYARLVTESRRLQKQLRNLTHQILAAQEAERKKTSRELNDEVAQTLMGINIRLLTLKQEVTLQAEKLQKEIASTQQLVEQSSQTMRRFTREFGKPHDT
jgi:signal transduction histidine kinase